MSPDISTLIAALVAACAVLVASAAVGLVLLARRLRMWSTSACVRLDRAGDMLCREAPRVRLLLGRLDADVERIRRQDAAMDARLVGMSASLLTIRRTIEGVTQGRLATFIRGAGILSRVAQFALLWR